AGIAGRLRSVHAVRRSPVIETSVPGTDLFTDVGVHDLDLLRFLIGRLDALPTLKRNPDQTCRMTGETGDEIPYRIDLSRGSPIERMWTLTFQDGEVFCDLRTGRAIYVPRVGDARELAPA